MIGAVLAALASSVCFATGAVLQQREAMLASTTGVADPRLLWRLAHRPLWLVGVLADGLSAGLHILALSLGTIALVQPLGVAGLVFAVPIVAIVRRQRIALRDIAAALTVLVGLALLLSAIPLTVADHVVVGAGVIGGVVGTSVVISGGLATLAHHYPGRVRAVLLAAGAGGCFGIVAVLVRVLLQLVGRPDSAGGIVAAGVGICVLVPLGYLQLQNAYRVGHFTASLATAMVLDPLAAIGAGVLVLHEQLPQTAGSAVVAVAAAGMVIGAIAVLVRSPAHLLAYAEPAPR